MSVIPSSPPGNTPAVGDSYFETAWANFFDDLSGLANAASPLADPMFTGTVTMDVLNVSGAASFSGSFDVTGNALFHGEVGFYGVGPVGRPTVTGSRTTGGGVASLLTALASQGLIIDGTTP